MGCVWWKQQYTLPGISSPQSQFIQSSLTLCNPMDCCMLGFPVHHQLPELAQTHVHRLSNAIQRSHPLSSPVLLPSIFPSIRIFSNESFLLIRWPKNWNFSFSISPSNEYSGLISFRIDWLDLLAVQDGEGNGTPLQYSCLENPMDGGAS